MSPDDLAVHAAVLDRWFTAYNRHDVDALCEMADPAIEVVPLPDATTSPPGAIYHGHSGLRSLLTAGFSRFPRLRLKYGEPRPNGTGVVVDIEFVLDDGVSPPTVRKAACRYRIRNGLIRRLQGIDRHAPTRTNVTRADSLSPREREILAMLAGGQTVAEIARTLYLSPFTVRTHIRNAKDKLQARTTAHAIAIALEEKALDV